MGVSVNDVTQELRTSAYVIPSKLNLSHMPEGSGYLLLLKCMGILLQGYRRTFKEEMSKKELSQIDRMQNTTLSRHLKMFSETV